MSDDLRKQFEAAAEMAKELPAKPGNSDLLELYAFYKQGSSGDVRGTRPGFMDFVGAAKFDAWEKLKGMERDEAMQKYVDKVAALRG